MIRDGKVTRTVTPFRQVATEVFPTSTPRIAMQRLRKWIADDPELHRQLLRVGYSPRKPWLSPSMLLVLDNYL